MGEQLSEADIALLESFGVPDPASVSEFRMMRETMVAIIHAARTEGPGESGGGAGGDDLKRASIDAIALLDVAIAGTAFTKPDSGRVVVNVAKAQKVLDALKAALRASPPPLEGVGRPTLAEAGAFAEQSDDPIAEMLRKAAAANERGDTVGVGLFIHAARLAYATQALSSTGAAPC